MRCTPPNVLRLGRSCAKWRSGFLLVATLALPSAARAQSLEPDSLRLRAGAPVAVQVLLPQPGTFLLQLRARTTGSPLLDRIGIVVDSAAPAAPTSDTLLVQGIAVQGVGSVRLAWPRRLLVGTYPVTLTDSAGRVVGAGTLTVTRSP